MRLYKAIADTKFRIFEVGDKIVHLGEPSNICTIESLFIEGGRKLMKLTTSSYNFCPSHWNLVK